MACLLPSAMVAVIYGFFPNLNPGLLLMKKKNNYPIAIRMEGSFYIEAGLHLIPNKPDLVKENQGKFESLSKKLGKFKRAYLMATGPSISNYKKYEFENSINIVCNSVILDEDLMQVVKPQILVFAGLIFHFGPSQYSGAFRKSLVESARLYDFTICIPFEYYESILKDNISLSCKVFRGIAANPL